MFGYTIPDFTRSAFYWDGFFYHLRYGKSGTWISINESEFNTFLKIFNDFHTELTQGTLKDAYCVRKSTISMDFMPMNDNKLPTLRQNFYSPLKKSPPFDECAIYYHKDPWYVNGEFDERIHKQILDDLGEPSCIREVFYPDIDFDSHLIYTLSSLRTNLASENEEVITSPPPSEQTSFCDAIRYVIAKYYTVFGSFNRIKICKSDTCERSFIEKKIGSKLFCSNKCRMEYNATHQPQDTLNCRNRQNQWIRNKLGRRDVELGIIPDHVHKEECDECREPMESGQCPVLIRRNANLMHSLEKLPKRQKRTIRIR